MTINITLPENSYTGIMQYVNSESYGLFGALILLSIFISVYTWGLKKYGDPILALRMASLSSFTISLILLPMEIVPLTAPIVCLILLALSMFFK